MEEQEKLSSWTRRKLYAQKLKQGPKSKEESATLAAIKPKSPKTINNASTKRMALDQSPKEAKLFKSSKKEAMGPLQPKKSLHKKEPPLPLFVTRNKASILKEANNKIKQNVRPSPRKRKKSSSSPTLLEGQKTKQPRLSSQPIKSKESPSSKETKDDNVNIDIKNIPKDDKNPSPGGSTGAAAQVNPENLDHHLEENKGNNQPPEKALTRLEKLMQWKKNKEAMKKQNATNERRTTIGIAAHFNPMATRKSTATLRRATFEAKPNIATLPKVNSQREPINQASLKNNPPKPPQRENADKKPSTTKHAKIGSKPPDIKKPLLKASSKMVKDAVRIKREIDGHKESKLSNEKSSKNGHPVALATNKKDSLRRTKTDLTLSRSYKELPKNEPPNKTQPNLPKRRVTLAVPNLQPSHKSTSKNLLAQNCEKKSNICPNHPKIAKPVVRPKAIKSADVKNEALCELPSKENFEQDVPMQSQALVANLDSLKNEKTPSKTNTSENQDKLKTPGSLVQTNKSRKSKKVTFYALPEEPKSALRLPKTPLREMSMREKLEMWLEDKGHSLRNYRHLHCFGHKVSEFRKKKQLAAPNASEDKENFCLNQVPFEQEENLEDTLDVGASPALRKMRTPKRKNKSWAKLAFTTPSSFDVSSCISSLDEIKNLLLGGYPTEEAQMWMGSIVQFNKGVVTLPLWWEVQSLAEEKAGNLSAAMDVLNMAVERNLEPIDEMATIIEKFLLRNRGNIRSAPSTPCRAPLLDQSNIFSSTHVRLAKSPRLSKTPKADKEGCAVLIPVRRCARLSTWNEDLIKFADGTYDPNKLPSPLKQPSPIFEPNRALLN